MPILCLHWPKFSTAVPIIKTISVPAISKIGRVVHRSKISTAVPNVQTITVLYDQPKFCVWTRQKFAQLVEKISTSMLSACSMHVATLAAFCSCTIFPCNQVVTKWSSSSKDIVYTGIDAQNLICILAKTLMSLMRSTTTPCFAVVPEKELEEPQRAALKVFILK